MRPAGPFLRPRPVDSPALRFIAFHHAGGSAAGYHPLVRELPDDWDVLLLDLPGRGKRHAEPPLSEMRSLIDRAARDVHAWTDAPYALFGHSLGAIIAAEAGQKLGEAGAPPLWVGVSGRAAPDAAGAGRGSAAVGRWRLSELDDENLLAELMSLGGIPAQLSGEPEILGRFLRTVRADLCAVDSYAPDPGRLPLACPLTAFGGVSDAWAPPAALAGWAKETTGRFRRRLFPGGHFYFVGVGFGRFARNLAAEARRASAGLDEELNDLIVEPVR